MERHPCSWKDAAIPLLSLHLMVFGACVFHPMTIRPTVDPAVIAAAREPGAENVDLAIPLAEDTRSEKDVGTRGDVRFGAEVTTEKDVSQLVTEALRSGFTNKGYHLVESNQKATLKIRILEYRTALQPGFWASKATARVLIAASLIDEVTHQIEWEKEFSSVAEKGRVLYDSKKHREITLTDALSDVVGKILSDQGLRASIRKYN